MFLLGFRRKPTPLALYKSIESALQLLQIYHRKTFATIQNPAVYFSGARVSICSTFVSRLSEVETVCATCMQNGDEASPRIISARLQIIITYFKIRIR